MVYGAALEQSNKQKASDERLGGGISSRDERR